MRVFSIILKNTYGVFQHCGNFFRKFCLVKVYSLYNHECCRLEKSVLRVSVQLSALRDFLKKCSKGNNFQKDGLLWFVGEKLFSSLMRILSVIFRHSKNVKKIQQYCPFVHLKNFTLLNR